MEWDKGYSASYYMMEVDPITWKDVERFEIKAGSLTRNLDGLRQSASFECVNYPNDKERYVRIYLDAIQSGSGAHEALFTGLATSPELKIKGTWNENTVQCFSILKPADDIILSRGYYAAAGVSCTTILRELLAPLPAPIEFDSNAPALTYSIVAENGETNLSMAERILEAIGWNMRIFGDGHIRFEPYQIDPIVIFDPLEFDVIETEISISSDLFDCPNVLMVTCNSQTAIAKDENPDSPVSIQNRGREVWAFENGVALNANETIGNYTKRRLKELQQYKISASYDRRFVPEVFPGDVVRLHYPAQGLNDDFMVKSQTVSLGYSARTSEEIIGVK